MTATTEKMVTEKEAVLRQREAYKSGARALYIQEEIPGGDKTGVAMYRIVGRAATEYPLPKVSRPSVAVDVDGDRWRWTDARGLEIAFGDYGEWTEAEGFFIADDCRATVASVLKNPNELVDE